MSDLIEDHLASLRAGGYSGCTIRDRGRVLRVLDVALLYGIEAALHVELVTWLDRPDWSVQTKATYRTHIVEFYRWAAARGHLSYDPSEHLVRPRVPKGQPRPASEEQVIQALAQLPEPWRTCCLLAAFAGLRAAEVAGLARRDVTAAQLIVRGKGGKVRVVPTHPLVWAAIEPLPAGQILRGQRGQVGPNRVSARVAAACRAIGLDLTLHQFRHRFATQALRHHGNLRVVQELLGHGSPATTAIYTAVDDDERRAAINALPSA